MAACNRKILAQRLNRCLFFSHMNPGGRGFSLGAVDVISLSGAFPSALPSLV